MSYAVRPAILRRAVLVAALALGMPSLASAQHYFEARLADPTYRYFDWNYTFSSSAIVDLFYVGVPGSDEFNYPMSEAIWFPSDAFDFAEDFSCAK